MSSFQVGNTCYQTALQANQVTATTENGRIITMASQSYIVTPGLITDDAITYKYSPVPTGAPITQVFQSIPAPCGLLETGDSLLLAWGVAVVWLIAAGINSLRQGVHE